MMAAKKKTKRISGKHASVGVLIHISDDEREAWARAARSAGMTRADWIREVLRRAAKAAGS